jgi:mono/diheme cytochrome c family protein
VRANGSLRRLVLAAGGLSSVLLAGVVLVTGAARDSKAGPLFGWACRHHGCATANEGEPAPLEVGGTWYWLRSPDEEKRVVSSLFNRYCIRCHGVDGRGVWDMPDIPDFTDTRWQASRSDGHIATIILEGRGAVMPPFRGTLSLEEAWAMARYLRTFVPGTEEPRPETKAPEKSGGPEKSGRPEKLPMPEAPPGPPL